MGNAPVAWLRPHILGSISIAAAVLAVGGCTAPIEGGLGPNMEGAQVIAPDRSIVILPSGLADARLAVRRDLDGTTLQERVVLANDTASPGENTIAVRTEWRGSWPLRWFTRGLPTPFTAEAIQARIDTEFPDRTAITPPLDRRNRHGDYRYVAAEHDDMLCVLAWQLIDAEAAVTEQVHSFAVEFRFCQQQGDPDQLLALFDQIELQPYL